MLRLAFGSRLSVAVRLTGVRLVLALIVAIGGAAVAQLRAQGQVVTGANVNMVKAPNDPFLNRQIEGSIAVSTRNPCTLMGAGIDYRLTFVPGAITETLDANLGDATNATADAWISYYVSSDCGQRWKSRLIAGHPLDTSPEGMASPLKGDPAAADPVLRAAHNGLFYLLGMTFARGDHAVSKIFLQRFIHNNNKEQGDSVQDLGTIVVQGGQAGQFLDKPWLAVDIPRAGFGPQAAPWISDDTGQQINPNEGTATAAPNGSLCNINGQVFPAGNVYAAWARFEGPGTPNSSKIMFGRSVNCGLTFDVKPVSTSTKTAQGASIAIAPADGTVYLAWREIARLNRPHGVWVMKSTDGGKSFSKPKEVATISPFDQIGTRTAFRTNAMPTMTVLASGQVIIAWAERGFAQNSPGDTAAGDSRIVFTVSSDGGATWSPRRAIDDSLPARPRGSHQVLPSVVAASGKVTFSYLDFRDDQCLTNQTLAGCGTNRALVDGIDHTGDLFGAQATAGTAAINPATLAATVVKISKYRTGFLPDASGNPDPSKPASESFHVNLPIFAAGTKAGISDYTDSAALAAIPIRRSDTTQEWVANGTGLFGATSNVSTSANGSIAPMNNFFVVPVVHHIWTDLRNLIPPPDGNWANFTPPKSTFSDPAAAPCDDRYAGTRNADLYTSRTTPGMYAGIVGNTKNLGFRKQNGVIVIDPVTNQPEHLQRAFVLFVQNTTVNDTFYRLRIMNQPGPANTDRASFMQFPAPPFNASNPSDPRHDPRIAPQTDVYIKVPRISTESRTVFVTSAMERAQVRIDVDEVGGLPAVQSPPPAPIPGGKRASIMINPDLTNPPILQPDLPPGSVQVPDIRDEEVHTPLVLDLNFFDINAPQTNRSDVRTPADQNPADQNPADQNPADQNPADQNPADQNVGAENSAIGDPENYNVRDFPFHFKNTGNTISRFRFSPVVDFGTRTDLKFQAIIAVRNPLLNVDANCDLVTKADNQVVVNMSNFSPRTPADQNPADQNPADQNPADQNPADQNSAYFFMAPGDEGTAFLRVYYPKTSPQPGQQKKVAAVVAADAADTGEEKVTTAAAGADLTFDTPPAPPPVLTRTQVTAGNVTQLNWTLLNRGTSAAQAFDGENPTSIKTRFWFSANNAGTVTTGDQLIFTANGPNSLPACPANNQTICRASFQQSLTLPQNAVPGNYFIKVIIDGGIQGPSEVFEADDFNNATSLAITILPFTLQFSVQPSETTQGWYTSPAVQVTLIDSDAQPALYMNTSGATPLLSGAPQLSLRLGNNPTNATLSHTAPQPTINGRVTFGDVSIDLVGNGYTLVAADTFPIAIRTVARISAPYNILTDLSPVTIADGYTTPEDTPLNVPAPLPSPTVNNDTDDPGKGIRPPSRQLPLKVAADDIGTRPTAQGGSVTLSGNGSFVYTPALNFFGADTFQYKAFDGFSNGNIESVTITVTEVNDPPTAAPDAKTTAEDNPLSFAAATLTTNDSPGPATPVPPNESTQTLTVSAVTATANTHGTVVLQAGGTILYSPEANYNGPASFQYQVCDNGTTNGVPASLCATSLVNVTITEVNDAPVPGTDTKSTNEDTALSFAVTDLSANDATGPANESTQTLNVTSVNVTNTTHGTVTLTNGTVLYTPAPNYNGPADFTYVVCDNGTTNGAADVLCATGLVNVTVIPVNDDPVANDDSASTVINKAVTIAVLANDTDIDLDTLSVTSTTAPANGATAINPDQTVVYTPAPGFFGTDSFDYTMSDGHGGTDTAHVTVIVAGPYALVALDAPPSTNGAFAVIDWTQNTISAPTTIGIHPTGASVTPDGKLGVIAEFGTVNPSASGQLRVINLTTSPATVVGTIVVPAIPNPESTAITRDGKYAIVADGNPGGVPETDVVSVDLATGAIVSTVTVSTGNHGVAITPDGGRVLILSSATISGVGTTVVSVLTLSPTGVLTNTAQQVTVGGGGARNIAITPNGHLALVTRTDGSVVVLAIGNPLVTHVTTITGLGNITSGLAIAPDGAKAYVTRRGANAADNQIAVLGISAADVVTDTGTRVPLGTGGTPEEFFGVPGITLTPDGAKILVSGYEAGVIRVLNASDYSILATFTVNQPSGIGVARPEDRERQKQ